MQGAAPTEEDRLDAAFVNGIKQELASIEENKKNIRALSQVFRYYAKHAKQLSQVLYDFATRQCFPWEVIHAVHLTDDIFFMDQSGRYKLEFQDMIQGFVVAAFKKVPSDQERREVAKMLQAWQELRIFDSTVLEAAKSTIRSTSASGAKILEEAAAQDDDDEATNLPGVAAPAAAKRECPSNGAASPSKRRRESKEALSNDNVAASVAAGDAKATAASALAREAAQAKAQAVLDGILAMSLANPFKILGISEEGAQGHDIRKAYRRIALLIHPDKNPGLEAKCQEALIKLQQGRELAENELQRLDALADAVARAETDAAARADTRSAATAANNAGETCVQCRYPDCELAPCRQCANGCCTRNITHCHTIARSKGGLQCFFHPPPRAWARSAT